LIQIIAFVIPLKYFLMPRHCLKLHKAQIE
jgi:hypothetical protein